MGRPSHEFFAGHDSLMAQATPLSTHFDQRLLHENDAQRDSPVPDHFDIPDNLLQESSATTSLVDVTGDITLRISGHKSVQYQPSQVRVLNTIFRAGRYITDREVAQEIGTHRSSEKRQVRVVHELYDKLCLAAGGFLVRQQVEEGSFAYAVSPATTFNDRRGESQLSAEQQERQRILSRICTRFNNDPAVLRELRGYAMSPMDIMPEQWSARRVLHHQTKDFERLTRDESNKMLVELEGIIEAYAFGDASDDDQRRAAVLCNTLIGSFLGLGHVVAFSTLGLGKKRIRSPVNELLAYFPRNSMDRPEDDVYALAGLGVVCAIQTYDKKRGDLATHVISQVSNKIRDGIMDDRRHMYGKTQHEIKEKINVPTRRMVIRGRHETGELFDDLPEPRTPEPDSAYELLLKSINAAPFVREIFGDKALRPSEKLVLSLTHGIYNEEFEGKVLQTSDGRTFTYDKAIRANPLFREGMSDRELSRMFSVSVSQIARLRESAFRKVEHLMRAKLFMDHGAEKWKEWLWQ